MIAFSKLLCKGAAAASLAAAPAPCLQLTATPQRGGLRTSLPRGNMFADLGTPSPSPTITPSKRRMASDSSTGTSSRRKLNLTSDYRVSDNRSDARPEKINFDTPETADVSTPAATRTRTPTYMTPLRTAVVKRYAKQMKEDSAKTRKVLGRREGELVGFYKAREAAAAKIAGKPFKLWRDRNNRTCECCYYNDDRLRCSCVFDVRGISEDAKNELPGALEKVATARDLVAHLHPEDERDWGHQYAINLTANTSKMVEGWRTRANGSA